MTNITELQKVIRDYYKQLYANKMDSLEMYYLSRLYEEEIENRNRSITSNEIVNSF